MRENFRHEYFMRENFRHEIRREKVAQIALLLSTYWKTKFLKQVTHVKYVIAKLSKVVQISMLTSTESFLQRIL